MRKRYYIGADPGKSGAICAVDFEGVAEVITKTNRSYAYIWDKVFQPRFMKSIAVIESVHAMPGQGVSSTFKFGESFGMLLGRLELFAVLVLFFPSFWKN